MPIYRRLRAYLKRPALIRPLALAGPVLVLLACLPMLRPLRHAGAVGDDEALRLATVGALVHAHSLALDRSPAAPLSAQLWHSAGLSKNRGVFFSSQPPMLAMLLSGPAWVMEHWFHYSLAADPEVATYILTLLGATIPAAVASGLIYRMGRLFEMPRQRRALLAIAVVFASGLTSYAVVLNPHAPAAALLLAAAACLIHVETAARPSRMGGWLALAGVAAALATTIDPPAGILALLLAIVIVVTRFSLLFRIGGLLLFLIGAAPVFAIHAAYVVPLTGDVWPGENHPELRVEPLMLPPASFARTFVAPNSSPTSPSSRATAASEPSSASLGTRWTDVTDDKALASPATSSIVQSSAAARSGEGDENALPSVAASSAAPRPPAETTKPSSIDDYDEDVAIGQPLWLRALSWFGRLLSVLVGGHGLLSHFPAILLGFAGVGAVMHRHWPTPIKWMAAAAATAVGFTILLLVSDAPSARPAMFGPESLIVFLPMLLFWAGAWARRPHRPLSWGIAITLVILSCATTLVGATDPAPPGGYDGYTLKQAAGRMISPPKAIEVPTRRGVIARPER